MWKRVISKGLQRDVRVERKSEWEKSETEAWVESKAAEEKVDGEARLLKDFEDGNIEKAAVKSGNYSEWMWLWSTM